MELLISLFTDSGEKLLGQGPLQWQMGTGSTFSIAGDIKPKGTRPMKTVLSCKIDNVFKFALKCSDWLIMNF